MNIGFLPVTTGSPENEKFYKFNPGGEIKMMTINEKASEQFVVGKDYYIDFSIADQS